MSACGPGRPRATGPETPDQLVLSPAAALASAGEAATFAFSAAAAVAFSSPAGSAAFVGAVADFGAAGAPAFGVGWASVVLRGGGLGGLLRGRLGVRRRLLRRRLRGRRRRLRGRRPSAAVPRWSASTRRLGGARSPRLCLRRGAGRFGREVGLDAARGLETVPAFGADAVARFAAVPALGFDAVAGLAALALDAVPAFGFARWWLRLRLARGRARFARTLRARGARCRARRSWSRPREAWAPGSRRWCPARCRDRGGSGRSSRRRPSGPRRRRR